MFDNKLEKLFWNHCARMDSRHHELLQSLNELCGRVEKLERVDDETRPIGVGDRVVSSSIDFIGQVVAISGESVFVQKPDDGTVHRCNIGNVVRVPR